MASPRSMWSGSISLGLLSIPVSIGKSWSEDREAGLRDLCLDHKVPIDRTERCGAGHDDCTKAKVKGVQMQDGTWKLLGQNEQERIETASASDVLAIEDVQPMWDLPIAYGIGTYYVRYNPPKKGSTAGLDAFAALVASLGENGAVVMWKRASSHDLCVLHTSNDGMLLLTKLPTVAEHREPGDKERAHSKVDLPEPLIEGMRALLAATSKGEGNFAWEQYTDEATAMRTAAVEKILAGDQGGEQKQEKPEPQGNAADLMAQLSASIEMQNKGIQMGEGQKV